jgi:hypothetical protein
MYVFHSDRVPRLSAQVRNQFNSMHINRQVMVARQPRVESILSSNLVRHRLNSTTTISQYYFQGTPGGAAIGRSRMALRH